MKYIHLYLTYFLCLITSLIYTGCKDDESELIPNTFEISSSDLNKEIDFRSTTMSIPVKTNLRTSQWSVNSDEKWATACLLYTSFGGRATPLILLDDVEISTADLNNIPAETIESFSILKDASATAIYGARGANGVMLITTKTGKENEKTRINVTVENSFNKPMNFPDFVNGATSVSYTHLDVYKRQFSIPVS